MTLSTSTEKSAATADEEAIERQRLRETSEVIESGMNTGQGADDEPEMTIADKHAGEARHLSEDEAETILGG